MLKPYQLELLRQLRDGISPHTLHVAGSGTGGKSIVNTNSEQKQSTKPKSTGQKKTVNTECSVIVKRKKRILDPSIYNPQSKEVK